MIHLGTKIEELPRNPAFKQTPRYKATIDYPGMQESKIFGDIDKAIDWINEQLEEKTCLHLWALS